MRICTNCKSEVSDREACKKCTLAFESIKSVSGMTIEERVAEFRSRATGTIEIKLESIFKRIDDLVGRTVFSHELSSMFLIEEIVKEIETGKVAKIEDILGKIPADENIIVSC